MSLLDILRNGVATVDSITKPLQPKVEHRTWIGQEGDGTPIYVQGLPIMRDAIIERKTRAFRDATGEVVQSRHVLTFAYPVPPNGEPGRNEPIDERDVFVLPGGDVGRILSIEEFTDRGTSRGLITQVWLA